MHFCRVLLVALACSGWLATACSGSCDIRGPATMLESCTTDADCASPLTCLPAAADGARLCTTTCTAVSQCPVVTVDGVNATTCTGGFCGFLFCE